jgi:hypothetical protein
VYDALRKLETLQAAAAALGDAPYLGSEIASVVNELEVSLTAPVVDPVTGATALTPAYLNGGLPHHVMVPAPPKEGKVLPHHVGGPEEAESGALKPEAAAEAADPAFVRELVGLHAEPDLGRPWPTRVVTVTSVYDEWDGVDMIPSWANNSADPSRSRSPRAVGYTVGPLYTLHPVDDPELGNRRLVSTLEPL